MSSPLATIDLTGASIGTQATIDFSGFVKFNPAQQNVKAHLRVSNDSGCGLSYKMVASGSGDYIPAGGWHTIELADNDSQMLLTVLYLLPNPPVSIVMPTYYAPGESVPPAPILGNSPVGIGGSVSTSGNSLTNEGAAVNTEIIDIGPAGNAKALDIFNDHFTWSVVQTGVAHQVLKGQTAGNPLQIGQVGDISEVLGKLTVDGISSLDNGTITTDGNGNFNAIGSKTTLNGSIAGTLQYSFPFWGTGIKLMIITLHGYNSALKNIPLPSSLSRGLIVATDLGGGSPVLQPKIGVTNVVFNAITALGGAGNGTQSSVSNIKQDSMGSIPSTIDNFDFTPGGVADGTIIMIGH